MTPPLVFKPKPGEKILIKGNPNTRMCEYSCFEVEFEKAFSKPTQPSGRDSPA